MKKLLILAYDFPPYVSVGGLRPWAWFKYLKEFGVEPVVVTRNWTNEHGNGLDYVSASPTDKVITEETAWGTIIRTPYTPTRSNRWLLKHGESKYRFARKLLTFVDEVRQFITVSGPKKELYHAAEAYLRANKVDAIIATGDPFVLFYYARKLGSAFNIPWIADYRDPWSHSKNNQLNKLYHKWIERTEVKNVSTSTYIITVSDFLKFKLQELMPEKEIDVFPNGYDPEIIDEIALLPQNTDRLTISFVGTIYEWHPWKSFLTVFSGLIETSSSLQLNLYGVNNSEEIAAFVKELPEKTRNAIAVFPRMPNKDLLHRIAQENVMLLFNYYSYMGTKIFDYIGVGRKILLCYGNDKEALELKEKYYNIEEIDGVSKQLQADLIKATNSGIIVENEGHLKSVLLELLHEFAEKGKIACNSAGVENYSRKIYVKKLAEIVKDRL